jgi:hypothetical protein
MKNTGLIAMAASLLLAGGCANTVGPDAGCCPPKCAPCAPACKNTHACKSAAPCAPCGTAS